MGQIRGFFRSDFSAFGTGPGFVPFRANLTHFGAKPTIPGCDKLVLHTVATHHGYTLRLHTVSPDRVNECVMCVEMCVSDVSGVYYVYFLTPLCVIM